MKMRSETMKSLDAKINFQNVMVEIMNAVLGGKSSEPAPQDVVQTKEEMASIIQMMGGSVR